MHGRALSALLLALALSACKADTKLNLFSGDTAAARSAASEFGPSAVSLDQARLHFRNRDYGLAERHFRAAVEKDPNNPDAWLGLAATYDQLRRFELAARAYDVVVRQVGHTVAVHNNLGYHHYLQGNLADARRHFDAAQALEPNNPQVINNLRLVADAPSPG